MRLRSCLLSCFLLSVLPAAAQPAGEGADSAAVAFLKAEATERGEVMDHARWLTDVHGPRLTGSPQLEAAQRWAADRFRAWGLEADLDPWGTFGRGWTVARFALNARIEGPDVAPQTMAITAVPKAWSPSTGRISAPVVVLDRNDDAALERYRGQLRDKVVLLTGEPEPVDVGLEPVATRRDAADLLELANAATPDATNRRYSREALERFYAAQRRLAAVFGEEPLAILEPSGLGGTGSIRAMAAAVPLPEGATYNDRPQPWQAGVETVPQFVVLTEHYNRLLRLVEAGQTVTLDLDFEAAWTDDPVEYNVLAEIPGTDPALRDEVVMVGAHVDSWHGGTGATDNAAGSSVVMETARLLDRLFDERGEGPRRTIRFALWSGEEQGLLGSFAYVNAHLAEGASYGTPPTALREDHERFSAYYNLDNGTGRLRGVYLQGNTAVAPIFRTWLAAFADSTAQTLSLGNTGGTDHVPFDAAGLPGFQFIQDPVAYFAQTWHGSMDTFDHLVEDDLEQAAALIATFAYHTAQRDEKLPRKPLPPAPEATAGTN
jgi:hypothetical protein